MKLYMAGYGDSHVKQFLCDERKEEIRILLSYYYMTKNTLTNTLAEKNSGDIFVDSGAFSAFTKKATIDLDDYCTFLKQHIDTVTVYAGLDVISDGEASMVNQRLMEEQGLDPLPCFHYGEDFSFLETYMDEYDYIAIGGLIAAGNRNIKPFLDKVFGEYICNKKGEPKVRIHGFAMTSPVLMARYPWYSVDSSSWNYGARNCFVYIPRMKNGRWDFTLRPHPLVLSTTRTTQLRKFRKKEWKQIRSYFDSVGMILGKSELKTVANPKEYELKDNEQWAIRKQSGTVEVIEEYGVMTSPHARNVLNIIYFQEMEKFLADNPPRFTTTKTDTSFGL